MAGIRVKNVSGDDREIRNPDGTLTVVAAGHSEEFDDDTAKGLLAQKDVWAKYEPRADKPAAKDKE